nr:MAG TPA: hypothetical protein [Caudoviricetes sp.]
MVLLSKNFYINTQALYYSSKVLTSMHQIPQ